MIFLPSAKFLYRPQTTVAPWTPLSLTNAVLYGWYKSDAGLTVSADGASVATWADQSTNNNHLAQATPANRMTFRTAANGIGGLPALQSAATTTTVPAQFFSEAGFAGNSGFSFYVVMTQDTYNANSQYTGGFSIGVTGGLNGVHHFCNHPFRPGEVLIRYDNLGDPRLSAYTRNPVVIKVTRSASVSDYKWKSTYDSSGTPSLTTTLPLISGFAVGKNYSGSVGSKIAEVIVCNRELTGDEEIKLNTYLRSRYGFDLNYGADLPVAGAALWLDASRMDTLFTDNALTTAATTDNGPVGGWKDLSGNNRHALQTTPLARPTWRTPINGLNGLGMLSFNGSSQWIMSPLTTATPYTQFVVVKIKDNTRINRVLHGGNSTQDLRYLFGSSGGNYAIYLSSNNSSWTGGALPLPPATSVHNVFKNLSVTNTGTSTGLQPYVNNTALNTVNGTLATFANMTIGYGPSSQYALMDLAEVIQYPRVLDATELASVNAYLSVKWGT